MYSLMSVITEYTAPAYVMVGSLHGECVQRTNDFLCVYGIEAQRKLGTIPAARQTRHSADRFRAACASFAARSARRCRFSSFRDSRGPASSQCPPSAATPPLPCRLSAASFQLPLACCVVEDGDPGHVQCLHGACPTFGWIEILS